MHLFAFRQVHKTFTENIAKYFAQAQTVQTRPLLRERGLETRLCRAKTAVQLPSRSCLLLLYDYQTLLCFVAFTCNNMGVLENHLRTTISDE